MSLIRGQLSNDVLRGGGLVGTPKSDISSKGGCVEFSTVDKTKIQITARGKKIPRIS